MTIIEKYQKLNEKSIFYNLKAENELLSLSDNITSKDEPAIPVRWHGFGKRN